MKMDTVIYWVRSSGPDGKDRVPMYFKGQWGHNNENGMRGDVKARPISLGEGKWVATYGMDAFENEAGEPIPFNIQGNLTV